VFAKHVAALITVGAKQLGYHVPILGDAPKHGFGLGIFASPTLKKSVKIDIMKVVQF
jgi:hypothetical protein